MAENPHLVAARDRIVWIKATDVPQLREILACSPEDAAKKVQAEDKANRKVYAYLASAASEDEIEAHLLLEKDALRAAILAARKKKLLLSPPAGKHAEIMAALDAFRVEHMQEFETEQENIFHALSGKKKSKVAQGQITAFEAAALERISTLGLNECGVLESQLKAQRSTTPDRHIADNNVCIVEYLKLASTLEEIRTHSNNRQAILQARVDKLLIRITGHKQKELRAALMQYQEFEIIPLGFTPGKPKPPAPTAFRSPLKKPSNPPVEINIGGTGLGGEDEDPPPPPPPVESVADYIAQTYGYLSGGAPKDFFLKESDKKNPSILYSALLTQYFDSYEAACKKSALNVKRELPQFTHHATAGTTPAVTYNNAGALLLMGDDPNLCLAGAIHLVHEGIAIARAQGANPTDVTFNLKLDPNIDIPDMRALENLLLSQITAFTVYGLKVNIVWEDFEAKYSALKGNHSGDTFETVFKRTMIDNNDVRFTGILNKLRNTAIHPIVAIPPCTRQDNCTLDTLIEVIKAPPKRKLTA